jgi:hypothetical protein
MIRRNLGRASGIALCAALAVFLSACGNAAPAPSQTPSPTATIVAVPATVMTHPVQDREDCRKCHVEGIARSKKMPADHSGYSNETCGLCHKQIGEK